jgi:glycosyltransferase involved in cell wall biosynthesis
MKKLPISVIIHCKNEEINIERCINNVLPFFSEIYVVDAGSKDKTLGILEGYAHAINLFRIEGTRHNLVWQRNWALENLPIKTEWVYIHDADELVTQALYDELTTLMQRDLSGYSAFWINYKEVIFTKPLRRSILYPNYSCRLLRFGDCVYENRKVNAHVVYSKKAGYLKSHFIHHDLRGFRSYLSRLSELSILEGSSLEEIYSRDTSHLGFFSPIKIRFVLKRIYYRLPFRVFFLFIYFYVVKGGFLEGREGLYAIQLRIMHEWAVNFSRYYSSVKNKD